jgi:RNA polymerase-binding transcription factor DksA
MNKPSHPATPAIDPRWAWHHRTLAAARRRLQRELTAHVHEAIAPGGLDGDQVDRAGEELDHDVALALLSCEGRMLAEIDDALRRIERGTYGTCEASGQPIPASRLRALPWCRYVAEVEATRERGRLRTPLSHA